jgi:hypothetical protein
MAIPVLIIGRSGSGKTYSLKGFNDFTDSIGVISVEKARLPFKSGIKVARIPKYEDSPNIQTAAQISQARYSFVERAIKSAKCKTIVIDDSQYLLADEFFDRAKENGYQKFTDIALNFRNLIHNINNMGEDDKIVYFLHHSEDDGAGREKVKTIGKMLDEKLTVEGCFDVVIYCRDQRFYTQGDGISSAKTPEGMFDSVEIPNDLKFVDDKIREYWNLNSKED